MHIMAFFLAGRETDFEIKSFLKEKWNLVCHVSSCVS